MKWMLIVMVLGTTPVETGLLYDTLDACYDAEQRMRAEYAKSFNTWLTWAKANPAESGYPGSQEFMTKRVSLGVCIPHAGQ